MSISKRLQMVIKMNGMTNASFADRIGVQRSSISHVLAGRNKPSIDFIQKILSTFPKVDADWLITGKNISKPAGVELKDEPSEASQEQKQQNVTADSFVAKDHEFEDFAGREVKDKSLINTEAKASTSEVRKISRVIVFYNDGTFEEVTSIG